MQRRFLRKRGAAGIPDHHFIKQKAIAFAFLHQRWLRIGAADEARTRYLHLGKVALYQMSYGRILGNPNGFPLLVPPIGIEPMTRGFSVPCSTD